MGGWEGGSRGKGYVYSYGWFSSRRIQQTPIHCKAITLIKINKGKYFFFKDNLQVFEGYHVLGSTFYCKHEKNTCMRPDCVLWEMEGPTPCVCHMRWEWGLWSPYALIHTLKVIATSALTFSKENHIETHQIVAAFRGLSNLGKDKTLHWGLHFMKISMNSNF